MKIARLPTRLWHHPAVTDNPWHHDVEVFPALVRSQTPHLLVLGSASLCLFVVAIASSTVRIFAIGALLLLAALAFLVVRPILRETLFVSDGGLVKTNGKWMVQVPWGDLCCLQITGSRLERRLTANYPQRPVLPLPPRASISQFFTVGLLQAGIHRMTMLSLYDAELSPGRFRDALAHHRPDLIPSGPVPIADRFSLCPHQTPEGGFERRLTTRRRILRFLPMFAFFGAGAILSLPNRGIVQLTICVVGFAVIMLAYSLSPRAFSLTVSPDGVTETFAEAASLHVPWDQVIAVAKSGPLGSSWIVHFSEQPARLAPGQTTLYPNAVAPLLRHNKGRRFNLTHYGLHPHEEPFSTMLAQSRPDLDPS